MIACIFEKVLDYNTYILKTKKGSFELVLEFYGVDKPKVGDKMLISEKLFDKNSQFYTQPYAFEISNTKKASEVKQTNDINYIVLSVNDKVCVLKRIYG